MPSQVMVDMIEPIQPSCNLKKIEVLQTKQRDIASKLGATWLGQVYRSHLKRYVIIRWIVQGAWCNIYTIYVKFYVKFIAIHLVNRKSSRWLQLFRLSEFAKKEGIPTSKLADASLIEAPLPKVFPTCDHAYLASTHERIEFPEIYVATISNAMVYGGTNLVLAGGEVVCHDLYDFERDYTSEEFHNYTQIDPGNKRIRWLLHDEAPEPIPVAAAFVDACGLNYAHWMTEVLPRIALFCAEERYKDIPVVVNNGLHQNIMESLFLIAGATREIITLPIGRAIAVNELYLTSVAGYVPFDRRTNKLSGHSQGVFSSSAFEILRNHLNPLGQKAAGEAWPEKIFLRRNSGTRKISNAAEIEKLLVIRDYVAVEPEKLTFLQQVQLFYSAKQIVSPTGAALVNAIFCKPGTQVAVLMSKHENMIYRYWINLLNPFGIKVNYVLGNIINQDFLGIHGDFAVNVADVVELLDTFEKK